MNINNKYNIIKTTSLYMLPIANPSPLHERETVESAASTSTAATKKETMHPQPASTSRPFLFLFLFLFLFSSSAFAAEQARQF